MSPDSPVTSSQLAFWDEELVAYGSRLLARRLTFVRWLANLAADRFDWLTGAGRLQIRYVSTIDNALADHAGRYEREGDLELVVARSFAIGLQEQRRDELRRGVSLIGPHRDDLDFRVDEVDLGAFGSRGQQRLAVVALKLAEADLMLQESKERPVVLLDDVLSELDPGHRRMLTEAITRVSGQVILTTTDHHVLEEPGLAELPRAKVERGTIHLDRECKESSS
jgi:DNA replication and repair protein RecF